VLAEEEREQHKLGREIVAEEHWLRYGVTGRRKRNIRRLGNLQALREARRTHRAAAGKATLAAAAADRSSTLVVEADRIDKAYEGRPIVADFSTRIHRGDRIGIIGPNGSGKTTLINLLTGTLAPDAGSVRLGANLAMTRLDQHRESLDPSATREIESVIKAFDAAGTKVVMATHNLGQARRLGDEVRLSPAATEFLVTKGYDQNYGARPLKRAIQKYIEDPLSEKILLGEFAKGDEIEVDASLDGTRLDFKVLSSASKA